MDIKQELNHKLFMQREENTRHLDSEKEFGMYRAIASGDFDEVTRLHRQYEQANRYTSGADKNGTLSQNPLQNRKFHFVILAALIARFCVAAGLEKEIAYSMSDIYIQKADACTSLGQIDILQTNMIFEYTSQMRETKKKNIYSKQIIKCVDYIYDNLNIKLTVSDIADHLQMSPTYLSKLFSKEVGMPISAYIKEQKLKAAANMLLYTDSSISEISEYFNFASQSHFTTAFQELYNLTPKKYRDTYSSKSMNTL